MNPHTLLLIILFIVVADFFIEQLLDFINLKHQKNELPPELKGIYDEEKFEKSQDYLKVNTRFGFFTALFNVLLLIVVIVTGFFGWLDAKLLEGISNPIWVSLAFFGIIFLVSDILNLPFSLYNTFVIEEKFGFNKTTLKTFITDKLKVYLLFVLIGGPLLYLFITLVNVMGQSFWVWFWLVITVFMLLVNMFYTSLIVPLFNKLKPLEEGELQKAIEEYSAKVKFPLDNIFVIDGSKRSSKANAFFSGIGKKKKIVLYDTLVNDCTNEELVAVLAHEVGHFKKKHVYSGFILSVLQTGLMLFVLSLLIFNVDLSKALGAQQLSVHINLIAFIILYTPISHILSIFMNIISRKNEFEADAYASDTFGATWLQNALKKLSVNNLSNLTPHPAYVFFHYSHPPVLQRLRAMERIK